MKDKSPVEVQIDELHQDGYGISRQDDLAVFGALPGETVTALPFTRRRKKTYAKTLDVISSAPDRVTPVCSAAHICGGCSLQHMDPASQVKFKQEYLFNLLGDNEPDEVLSPLSGPVTGYRGKARLGVKYVNKKGRVLVGFREKMKPYIAEIERCEVLREPVGALLPALGELTGRLSCPSAIPQIEVAAGDEDVALVFRHLEPLTPADVDELKAFARDQGISLYLQPGDPASAWKLWPPDGPERLYYTLPGSGLQFGFHPLDFVQVNAEINRKMVDMTVALLNLNPDDHVIDAFCGIGNFSLAIAKKAGQVLGLEESFESVNRARENAVLNSIENCVFERTDLLSEHLDLPALRDTNKLLLDPPRSGAESLVKKLASSKVERVVYVSCNPHTLARDTNVLIDSGYRLEKAGVLDMFPHTTHIESIAVYSRSN